MTETPPPQQKDENEMKRTLVWLVGAVFVSAGLVWALQTQEQQAGMAGNAPAAAGGQPAEKIAYTFTDDDQVTEYQTMLGRRQDVLIRMQVLQDYFAEEQERLKRVNDDIIAKYKLDSSKVYFLDTQRKVLLEREAPAEPEAGIGAPAAAGTPAAPRAKP